MFQPLASTSLAGKTALGFMSAFFGSFLYAFGLRSVLVANGLSEGGFAGLSAIVYFLFGVSVGAVYFAINIPLLFLGYRYLGPSFVFRTLIGVCLVSVQLLLAEQFQLAVDHPIWACLYAGLASGIGRGLMFRSGYTTGGVDIVAFIVHRWTRFPRAYTILIFDIFVMGLIAVFIDPVTALYSLFALLVASQILHRLTRKH